MRLNGWQRLWAFLTFLWFVPVIWLTLYSYFGTNSQLEVVWTKFALDAEYFDKNKKRVDSDKEPWLLDPPIGRDTSISKNKESLRRILNKYRKNSDFEKLLAIYLPEIDDLQKERSSNVKLGIEFLLIPPVSLYLIGYGVAWVRRGFKGDKS